MSIHYNGAILREPYSGVEVTVHGLGGALGRHGAQSYHLHLPITARPLPTSPRLTLEYLPAWATGTRLGRIIFEQFYLPRRLKRAQAKLLHAPAYVAPLFLPCPLVLTVHDLHVYTHPQFCSWTNQLHYRLLMPSSLRRAAAIITFSHYIKDTLCAHFPWLVADKIHVVPPGIDPMLQRVTAHDELRRVRARYQLPLQYLFFIGDLTARKNLNNILTAFALIRARHNSVHLVLAGAGSRRVHKLLQRQIDRLGVSTAVHCLGYVAAQDLAALYSMAELFLFPSFDEGFGLPPLEAMRCGCPVVCSGGATLENGGDAVLACDPTSPPSIAAAALTLLQNETLRQVKVELGYLQVQRFSWQKCVASMEQIYTEVKGSGRASSVN